MANIMNGNEQSNVSLTDWFAACAMAAAGGALPTLARIGSTLVADNTVELPGMGLYVGTIIFAVLGVVLCIAFRQTELRQALVIGIAAPGIITNIVQGLEKKDASLEFGLIRTAVAFERSIGSTNFMNVAMNRRALLLPVIFDSKLQIDSATRLSVRQLPGGSVTEIEPKGTVLSLDSGTKELQFSSDILTTKAIIIPPLGDFVVTLRISSEPNFTSELKWAFGGNRRGIVGGIHTEITTLTGKISDEGSARIQKLTSTSSKFSQARYGIDPEVASIIVELIKSNWAN